MSALEGGESHRAASYLLAPPLECLLEFGDIDAMQPDQLVGDDNDVFVDDLGGAGERIGTSAQRQSEQ